MKVIRRWWGLMIVLAAWALLAWGQLGALEAPPFLGN
jgi:hypothetical protein